MSPRVFDVMHHQLRSIQDFSYLQQTKGRFEGRMLRVKIEESTALMAQASLPRQVTSP